VCAEELAGDLAGEPIDRIPVAVVFLGRVDRRWLVAAVTRTFLAGS
jgi:hypothetical protein